MSKANKKCQTCGDEMATYDVPIEKGFVIPFTQWEILLRNWNGKAWYCNSCETDNHNKEFDNCFNEGQRQGYEEGFDEAIKKFGQI